MYTKLNQHIIYLCACSLVQWERRERERARAWERDPERAREREGLPLLTPEGSQTCWVNPSCVVWADLTMPSECALNTLLCVCRHSERTASAQCLVKHSLSGAYTLGHPLPLFPNRSWNSWRPWISYGAHQAKLGTRNSEEKISGEGLFN